MFVRVRRMTFFYISPSKIWNSTLNPHSCPSIPTYPGCALATGLEFLAVSSPGHIGTTAVSRWARWPPRLARSHRLPDNLPQPELILQHELRLGEQISRSTPPYNPRSWRATLVPSHRAWVLYFGRCAQRTAGCGWAVGRDGWVEGERQGRVVALEERRARGDSRWGSGREMRLDNAWSRWAPATEACQHLESRLTLWFGESKEINSDLGIRREKGDQDRAHERQRYGLGSCVLTRVCTVRPTANTTTNIFYQTTLSLQVLYVAKSNKVVSNIHYLVVRF
jgi:hypothetical protein